MLECRSSFSVVILGGEAMVTDQWFELRVTGSVGTSAGISAGTGEGIAVADNGRLCSVASGCARRFDSAQQALDYLGKIRVTGDYQLEVVPIGAKAADSAA